MRLGAPFCGREGELSVGLSDAGLRVAARQWGLAEGAGAGARGVCAWGACNRASTGRCASRPDASITSGS
eukprot:9203684-Pyramimonas_sp.AAC.1